MKLEDAEARQYAQEDFGSGMVLGRVAGPQSLHPNLTNLRQPFGSSQRFPVPHESRDLAALGKSGKTDCGAARGQRVGRCPFGGSRQTPPEEVPA